MAVYELRVLPRARKQLERIPADTRQRVADRLNALADNPRPHGSVKLAGTEAQYRIRVGDYRVLYEIRDAVLLVLVIAIGAREHVYRRR
jgi:mRNA interferase RelE/StbE